jgi:hypothetical protein
MRVIDTVDRADEHRMLRIAVVPAVYVLGALFSLGFATASPPAGRGDAFGLAFFAIALMAPLFAYLGVRAKAQVGWLIAWLGCVGMAMLAYKLIGLEILVAR